MSSSWTYQCKSCGQSLTLNRPRAHRTHKARCGCGGDALFTKAPRPAAEGQRQSGSAAIVIENGNSVFVTDNNVVGYGTGMRIRGSEVTVRGGLLRTVIGIDTDGESTIDVADVVHRVPEIGSGPNS